MSPLETCFLFLLLTSEIPTFQVPRVNVWEYFCIPDICIFCTPPLYENLWFFFKCSLGKLCFEPFRALCGIGKSTLLPEVAVVAHISFWVLMIYVE